MSSYGKTKDPKEPATSPEYTNIRNRGDRLVDRGLFRRAADMWSRATDTPGLYTHERDKCVTNARRCALRGAYKSKQERV